MPLLIELEKEKDVQAALEAKTITPKEVTALPPSPYTAQLPQGHVEAVSPMEANIWKLNVHQGDIVNEGDVIIVLEAMKMEVEVFAELSGIIVNVCVQVGQVVKMGECLCIIKEN